jgi:hypothetical protein
VKDPFAPLLYSHAIADGCYEMATAGSQPQASTAWEDPDEDIVKVKLVADGNFIPRRPNGMLRCKLPAVA